MSTISVPDYINPKILQVINPFQAWYYHILPFNATPTSVSFFIDNNQPLEQVKEELEILLGKTIEFIPISNNEVEKGLMVFYRQNKNGKSPGKSQTLNGNSDFLQQLILEAETIGSSDIHVESFENGGRVRFRIDGKLTERYSIPLKDYPALINKIKIKANLDIAEKRLPQDGRINYIDKGKKIDIRVSLLPTLHGEKVVMRLLSKDTTNVNIDRLGFSDKQMNDYLEGTKKPHGIVLISGPTGSGKTTTLYATLKILNSITTNILTIEDPIEYTLEGINQVQLKESIGLTFASALRTFLRQDPDIIMLGEIRDGETAQMAIRAALTGHLVLSTIHTNSAWGSISRLIDMGVPPFLIAATLNLSVAQRLVRKLCPHCKHEETINITDFPTGYQPPYTINKQWVAKGCPDCYFTGYHGRIAIYEVIPITHSYSVLIKNGYDQVSQQLKNDNIVELPVRAFELLADGTTSLDEVYPILLNSM